MSKKSIGHLHSEITANASQFVNEFKRADNEQRRASASIRTSVSNTMRHVQREFSLPKLAKGFMGGLGIGGGVQVMGMAMDRVAEMFAAGSERAKEMSEYVEKMREDLRAMHDKRFGLFLAGADAGTKPGVVERELENQRAMLARAEAAKQQALQDMQTAGKGYVPGEVSDEYGNPVAADPFGGRFKKGMGAGEVFDLALENQTKAIKEIESLQERIAELSNKHADTVKDATKAVNDALKKFFDPIDDREKEVRKEAEERLKERRERFNKAFNEAYNKPGKDPIDPQKFRAMERASEVRVDDMTRRGLGSGANYAELTKTTNSILKEMLDVLKRQSKYAPAVYSN
jgi:hypothetical protein